MIIKGKILSDEDENYIEDKVSSIFLDMTGDMVNNVVTGQLVANHPEVSKQQILLAYETFNAESHINYNKIYLSADFRTQLSNYNIVEGSYGLKVVVENNRENEEEREKEYLFDCSQMFGRVYNFFKDTKQSITIDIDDEEAIVSVSLYFYQVGGSFYNDKKEFLEYNNIPANLFVSNIDFRMGYDSSSFTIGEEKLFLTTQDNLAFSSEDEDLSRALMLRWLHWEENTPMMIDNTSDLDYSISWYQFVKKSLQKEEDKSLENDDNWKLLESNIIDDKSFVNYITLDSLNDEERIKVIVTYGEKNNELESEELIFSNKNFTPEISPQDKGIILTIEDETEGNYFLYGQDNLILNKTETNTLRRIKVEFQDYSNTDVNLLNKDEWTINWIYPTKNTMIKNPSVISSMDNIENDVFTYYISANYSPFLQNNIIKCSVKHNSSGKEYSSAVSLSFGPSGTNGSEATLVIKPVDNYKKDEEYFQNAIGIGEENSLTYEVLLFDSTNKEVDFNKSDLSYGLVGINKDKIYYNTTTDDKKITFYCKEELDNLIAPILQVTLSNYVSYDLTTQISIPVSADIKNYNYINGVTSILYKTDGTPYNYNYSNSYELLNFNNEAVENIKWDIELSSSIISEEEKKYYPTIDEKTNILKPLSFYIKELGTCAITARDSANNLLWSQAILITQNCFPSGTVNAWTGDSLEINESTGSILAPMLVAGRKNSEDNTFSGVMMGDLKEKEDESILTGIYGFRSGENTYAFREDGTAFIGGSGLGRIEFNGNEGVIQSSNYSQGDKGMSINLSEGTILANDFTLMANNKLLITSEEYQLAEEIFDENQTYYIKKDNGDYTVVETPEENELKNYYVSTIPFILGDNFFINWDGSINASAGNIGNWKIENGQLQGIGANFSQKISIVNSNIDIDNYIKEDDYFNLFTLKYNVGIQKNETAEDVIINKRFSTWVIEYYQNQHSSINSSPSFISKGKLLPSEDEISKELEDVFVYSNTEIQNLVQGKATDGSVVNNYSKVYYFFNETNPEQNKNNFYSCAEKTYNEEEIYYEKKDGEYIVVLTEISEDYFENNKNNLYYLDESIKMIKNLQNYGTDVYSNLDGSYYIYIYDSENEIDKTKDDIQNDSVGWIEVVLNDSGYQTKIIEKKSTIKITIDKSEQEDSNNKTKIILDPGEKNNPQLSFENEEGIEETLLSLNHFKLKNSINIIEDETGNIIANFNEKLIIDNQSIYLNLPTNINNTLKIDNKLYVEDDLTLSKNLIMNSGSLKGLFKKVTLQTAKSVTIPKNDYVKLSLTTTSNLSGYIPLGVIRITSSMGKSGKITGFQYVNNNKFYLWISNVLKSSAISSDGNTVKMDVVYARAIF